MSSKDGSTLHRRSLFPKSYSKRELKKGNHVSFSPYARCLKMESHDLTDEDKSKLWWQKSDYDDFVRVGRIISKAMLEGGSEIWLRSKSPMSSPRISDSDKYSMSANSSQEFYEIRDNWWHKFGQSRRGLEHITSHEEGRQRYLNGRSAVRSIIEEQQRQMMFLPKGYADVDKFRSIYLRETHWARILARAAGESDADAVRTNFDECRRKPREYYIKKSLANKGDYISTSNEIQLPIFMKAAISPKRSSKRLNLDANTASQTCFRRSQVIPVGSKLQKKNNKRSQGKAKAKISKKFANHGSSCLSEGKKSERNDPNNSDDASSSSKPSEGSLSSLAKMAAGWGVDEAQEDKSSMLIRMAILAECNKTVG